MTCDGLASDRVGRGGGGAGKQYSKSFHAKETATKPVISADHLSRLAQKFRAKKTKKICFTLTGQTPVWRCTLLAFLAVDMRTRFVIQQAREVFAVKAVC